MQLFIYHPTRSPSLCPWAVMSVIDGNASVLMSGVPSLAWKEPFTPFPQACQLSSYARASHTSSSGHVSEEATSHRHHISGNGTYQANVLVTEIQQRCGFAVDGACASGHPVHGARHLGLVHVAAIAIPTAPSHPAVGRSRCGFQNTRAASGTDRRLVE